MLGLEGDVAMFVGVLPAVDDLVAQPSETLQKRRVGGDAVRAESGADALQGEVILPAVVQHMQRCEVEDGVTRRTLQRGQALRSPSSADPADSRGNADSRSSRCRYARPDRTPHSAPVQTVFAARR